MQPDGVVPALDEAEAGHFCLSQGHEAAAIQQLAFKRGEEALTHRVVVGVTHRAHGRPHPRLPAALSERERRVLGALKWSSQHGLCWTTEPTDQTPLPASS